MRWWWVNQGKSFEREREHGLVWAGVTDARGAVRESRRAVSDARPGDVVVHYASGAIRAISVVASDPTVSTWDEVFGGPETEEGHVTNVRYRVLPDPIALDDIPMAVRLSAAPFDKDGQVLQGYFFPLDDAAVRGMLKSIPQLWG